MPTTVEVDTKVCSKCRVDKPLDDFQRMRRAKSGRQSACKPCRKASRPDRRREGRDYYERNQVAILEQQRHKRLTEGTKSLLHFLLVRTEAVV